MRIAVYIAAVLLAILHQDFWLWDNDTLVFDFLPVGLAYHIGYSIAAAAVWAAAIKYAWPSHVEDFAEGDPKAENSGS